VAPPAVFAAAGNVLLRSTDAGAHWEQAGSAPEYPGVFSAITDLAAAPNGTLYVGTGAGVYATADGTAWTPVSDGLASLYVNDLRIDPLDPHHLYAATNDGGIAALSLDE
jgi:photosystem II stability/assembly factor-like uncharacterized protein